MAVFIALKKRPGFGRRACWGGRQWGGQKPKILRNFLIAFLLVGIAFFVFIELQIKPIIELVASQQAHLEVVRLINEAVYSQLGQGVAYQQLINVHKDSQGNVVLMQPDTVRISRLATGIAKELEESVEALGSEGVDIPLGLLSGSTLIASWGPKLTIQILPMGEVSVDIRDEFVAAGINQTKHRVVIDVTVSMGIMIPFSTTLTEIKNSLPVVESIIVGPIPNTYLNWQGPEEDARNLPGIGGAYK